MNTISSLTTADLTTAFAIETRAHAFPWSEKTFASNQGERYLNLRLDVDGAMAAFAITQVVLDEATLFNIAVDPAYQRRGLGRNCLSTSFVSWKPVTFSPCGWRCARPMSPPSRSMKA